MAGVKRSRTAQGVAAERAAFHAMGLLDDPYAEAMLTRSWSWFAAVRRHIPPKMLPLSVTFAGLAGRVLWYDAQVRAALDQGLSQIVVVGAGYDTRAWRFGRPGVQFFELDHPVTQADKQQRAPGSGPVFVPVDLNTGSAIASLVAYGFDPSQPALFIVEGVTMYLERDVVESQLRSIAAATSVGSRLAIDFYPPSDVGTQRDRRQILAQRLFRVGSGEGFRLVMDLGAASDLVQSCGWEIDEVVGLRAAALALVPSDARLPLNEINEHKALVAATKTT